MSRRVLLVLPTKSYRAAAFLEAAARLGVELVVATDERSTLAHLRPGSELLVDLERPEDSARLAEALAGARPVQAVVPADESAVLTAAHLAARLGILGSPVAAAEATRDKGKLRARLQSQGVPQPSWQLWRAADPTPGGPFPCVVKPLNQAGSRGVIRADDRQQLERSGAQVRSLLGAAPGLCQVEGSPLLVEGFVPGPEVALEGLVAEGRLLTLAIYDKPDPLDGPYFEETIYTAPSELGETVLLEVARVTQLAVSAVGLISGAVHAELRLGDGPLRMIDLASRSIGGRCSRVLRFESGATLEELILLAALGEPLPETKLVPGIGGVMMLPIPGPGRLLAIQGQAEALATAGVDSLEIAVPVGAELLPLPQGDRYLGFMFAHGASSAEVAEALRSAQGQLRFELAAELPESGDRSGNK